MDGEDHPPLTAVPQPVSDSPHPHSIMWVQREKVFSRWKERVVVITEDYLQCFKKGSAKLSHVGCFLFQVEFSSIYRKQTKLIKLQVALKAIRSVTLVDRHGYLTVVMEIEKEDNLIVRRPENVREWYNTMHMRVKESKTRVMQTTEQFWTKKTVISSENMKPWQVARERIDARYQYRDTSQERPNSAASLDRRSRRKSRDTREKHRSASADHSRHRRTEHYMKGVNQFNNLRIGMLSDDSGNSSLSTYTSDSM